MSANTSTVTLYCGKQVPSDSQEWLRECEAKRYWEMLQGPDRDAVMETMHKKRGPEGVKRVMAKILEIEPGLVLGLPTKALRQAYAARVEARRGREAREALEAAVKALWHARQQPPAPPALETE